MTTYDTQFEIDAPAAQVWAALTDFPQYGDWNTALPALSGELKVGSTLSMQLDMGGRRPMQAKADVQTVVPGLRFSWRGHLGAEFLFTGIREFTLEPLESGRTRFRHVETIRGALVPLFLLAKRKAVAKHHLGFNDSIKRRAEELAAQPS